MEGVGPALIIRREKPERTPNPGTAKPPGRVHPRVL